MAVVISINVPNLLVAYSSTCMALRPTWNFVLRSRSRHKYSLPYRTDVSIHWTMLITHTWAVSRVVWGELGPELLDECRLVSHSPHILYAFALESNQ